jgi:DNA modification methylase
VENESWNERTKFKPQAADGFPGIKPKDLIGIPWSVAFALRADSWYLRSDIIWHKPNPMPESVTDRPSKAHEYLFLLSKSSKYYYDNVSIMQDVKMSSVDRLMQDVESQERSNRVPGKTNGNMKARASGNIERKDRPGAPDNNGQHQKGSVPWEGMKANKRTVWTVPTQSFSEAHFATFPEGLIVDCIKAGCPIDGIVLDPFMGAGTTALVTRKLKRNFIGFELNPAYIKIAEKRLYNELGMFL